MNRRNSFLAAAALLVLVAVGRILLTYRSNSQGFDEPCHISSAIEFLDKGTYTLDPVHPPLSRIALGLPLYLAGERFPKLSPTDPGSHNYNVVGNIILYGSGHYWRNLSLARLGILPFFLLAVVVVFLWTRRLFGDFAALMAVALFTTLPIVLAFSGLAYTDLPAAAMQFTALFAFATWLEKSTTQSTLLLGIAVGLALLSKFTALLFLPAAVVGILLCKWLLSGRADPTLAVARSRRAAQIGMAALLACVIVWGGYRFSVEHVSENMQLSPQSMPSFQHFPAPVRSIARNIVLWDPVLPAPALLRGLATAWVLNKSAPEAYLLGKTKSGGWWYFFLIGIGVKTPLPFLILCVVGLCSVFRLARPVQWTSLVPAASAIAILMVSMSVKYNAGLRHLLLVFPLLAVAAGCGASYLWRPQTSWRIWGRLVLAGLLVWQAISTVRAHSDYIAYFNELAGRDPSRTLVTGCDLDCGQDLFRLSQELRTRHVSHASIAVWSSADMSQMGLPNFDILEPFQPVSGWVAISMRSLRFGDVLHTTYPPGAFAWLERYQPVGEVGKTIRLYYIPPLDSSGEQGQARNRQE